MSFRTMAVLLDTIPNAGRVVWLGVRPARRVEMKTPGVVEFCPDRGLVGDRYSGRSRKRQVTMINWEDLAAIGGFVGEGPIEPALLRRNVVVSGVNLNAFSGRRVRVGDAIIEFTGRCHPCSRMEEVLGPGGYNAMRGRGGWNARVIVGGKVAVGDAVRLTDDESSVKSAQVDLFR